MIDSFLYSIGKHRLAHILLLALVLQGYACDLNSLGNEFTQTNITPDSSISSYNKQNFDTCQPEPIQVNNMESTIESSQSDKQEQYQQDLASCVSELSKIDSYEKYIKTKGEIKNITSWVYSTLDKYRDNNNVDALSSFINKLSSIYPSVKKILEADFSDSLPKNEKVMLANLYYTCNVRIAIAHLQLAIIQYNSNNYVRIPEQVQGCRGAKKRLRDYFYIAKRELECNYSEALSEAYSKFEKAYPELSQYFYKTSQVQTSQPKRFVPSTRMIERKFKNSHEEALEIRKSINNPSADGDLCLEFGAFIIQAKDAFQKGNLTTVEEWKENLSRLLKVEKEGYSLSPAITSLNNKVDRMVSFYEKLANLSKFSTFELYIFMKLGIIICVKAGELEEAKLRLQAMEAFYLKNKLPEYHKGYDLFQATGYAICGDYDKISELHQEAINKKIVEKNKRERKLQQIKGTQQLQVNTQSITTSITTQSIESKPIKFPNFSTVIRDPLEEAITREVRDKQNLNQEERLKRHQEAENKRQQEQIGGKYVVEEKSPYSTENIVSIKEETSDSSASIASPVRFYLPKRYLNIIKEIFDNNWKISRKDIEDFFGHLGQEVYRNTGSSHHVIRISNSIHLIQEGKVIGVVTELSANIGGNITAPPNWEGDQVPYYLQKQIRHFLDLIGLTKDNCFKANTTNHTSFTATK